MTDPAHQPEYAAPREQDPAPDSRTSAGIASWPG
jgi:hypothetical protein